MLPCNYWAAVGSQTFIPTIKTPELKCKKDISNDASVLKNLLLTYFDITHDEISAKDGRESVVYKRHMMAYVLYKYSKETYTSIGIWLKRDHSTIMTSCRLIACQLSTKWDSIYKDDMKNILEILKERGLIKK